MFATATTLNVSATAALQSYANQSTTRVSQFSFSLQAAQVTTATDSASISDQAKELADKSFSETIFFSLFGMEANYRSGAASSLLDILGVSGTSGSSGIDASFHDGKYKTLTTIAGEFFADFNNMTSLLGSVFAGLDLGAVSFALDGRGGITTEGEGAEKAGEVFAGNTTLVARFALMAARGALVSAGESEPGFQQAYNEDPPAAIREYIDALTERLFGFNLGYEDGTFTATVHGDDVAAADAA